MTRSFDLRSPPEVDTLSDQRVRGRESRVRRNSPMDTRRSCRRRSPANATGLEPARDLLDLARFKLDLEEALGCEVDIVTEAGLSPYLRERILAEARPL